MTPALTIGDFSRITHLSIKTLRRYHEAGLLEPAEVDEVTGYRYYRTAQVPTAQVIRRFRDLGMPVREIGEVVATLDPGERASLIAAHLDRLENQLEETRSAVASLRRLLAPAPPPVAVELRSTGPLTVAAIRATVGHEEVLDWYSHAMIDLRTALDAAHLTPTGPAGGLYDNELFTSDRGEAVVYLPVDTPPTIGRVTAFVVPPAELAVTVHHGPHDDIDVSYGALGSYLTDQALTVAGPVRESYLVGPRDTPVAAAWRTEIGWPIFRTSAG